MVWISQKQNWKMKGGIGLTDVVVLLLILALIIVIGLAVMGVLNVFK